MLYVLSSFFSVFFLGGGGGEVPCEYHMDLCIELCSSGQLAGCLVSKKN